MSDRNAMLDICDVAGDGGNLWFVIVLLGAIGLNLVLTCVLGACMLRGRGGGKAKGDEEAFDDVQGSVAKGALFDAGGGGSGGGGGGADLKRELLLFKRQLDAMDKKIDNKRVNEITASYLLHNAHDAIGNHVPTAAQVPCCRARLATRAAWRRIRSTIELCSEAAAPPRHRPSSSCTAVESPLATTRTGSAGTVLRQQDGPIILSP